MGIVYYKKNHKQIILLYMHCDELHASITLPHYVPSNAYFNMFLHTTM